jgi:hypothetical protein
MNTLLNSLSQIEKNKSFVSVYKDGASFEIKLSDLFAMLQPTVLQVTNPANNTPLDASAALQVDSTTQGILLPRMPQAQITAIASPAAGLLVYNTDLQCPCFYDGIGWRKVSHTNM